MNVKDRDVSNAGSQLSEPEAHGLHRSWAGDGVEEHWEPLLRRAVADEHAVV